MTGPPRLKNKALIEQMLEHTRHVIRKTIIPTWLAKVPKQFGTATAGTLKAAAWKTAISVYLPLSLITLWTLNQQGVPSPSSRESRTTKESGDFEDLKSDILHNTMHLAQAVRLAYRRRTSLKISDDYKFHVARYLEGLSSLYPHAPSRPNHHFMFHIGDFLPLFGPAYGWHCFPFERLIGYVQRFSSSHRMGTTHSFSSLHSHRKY